MMEHVGRALPLHPPEGVEPWDWRREWVTVALLFLAALLVRLPNAGGDLWLDELASLTSHIRLPFGEIFTTFISANQHVLYSLLARVSMLALGENAFAIRLPAILFGAAGVPALYFLARTVTSRREAIAVAAIVAVSYHHAYFSQSARGYTGYLFFSTMSTAFLFRGLAHDRRADWWGFVLTSVANLYMHLNGLFFLAGQAGGCLLLYGPRAVRDPRVRALVKRVAFASIAAGVLAGLLYVPIIQSMFHFFTTEDRNVGWLPSLALVKVILRDAAPGAIGLAAVAIAGAIGLAGFVSYARSAPLLLLTMVLPIVAGLGVVLAMGVGTYPRFFLILIPFGLLVAVRGLRVAAEFVWRASRIGDRRDTQTRGAPARGQALFVALVALAAIAGAARLPRLYALPKQDYTGAITFVNSQRAPGDLIAAAYMAQLGTQYYEPAALSARTVAELEPILERGAPVWLIGTLEDDMHQRAPDLAALIDTRFREVRRFPGLIGDGTMIVWRSIE